MPVTKETIPPPFSPLVPSESLQLLHSDCGGSIDEKMHWQPVKANWHYSHNYSHDSSWSRNCTYVLSPDVIQSSDSQKSWSALVLTSRAFQASWHTLHYKENVGGLIPLQSYSRCSLNLQVESILKETSQPATCSYWWYITFTKLPNLIVCLSLMTPNCSNTSASLPQPFRIDMNRPIGPLLPADSHVYSQGPEPQSEVLSVGWTTIIQQVTLPYQDSIQGCQLLNGGSQLIKVISRSVITPVLCKLVDMVHFAGQHLVLLL